MLEKVLFVTCSSNEIDFEKKPNDDFSNVPRLVELSWVLVDHKMKVLSLEKRHFMIPKTVKHLSKKAMQKYGIDMGMLNRCQENMSSVLLKFTKDLKEADNLVGIDLWFTKKLLNKEMSEIVPDSNFGQLLISKKNIDVLDAARQLVGAKYANLKSGVRRPSFKEVVKKLTGENIGDTYNEQTINYLMKSYVILKKLGILS